VEWGRYEEQGIEKNHKYRRKNTEEYGIKSTVEWGRYQEEGIEKNHKYRRKNTEEYGIKILWNEEDIKNSELKKIQEKKYRRIWNKKYCGMRKISRRGNWKKSQI